MFDDAAAFSDLGEPDGYDVADLFVDAAALYDETEDARGASEDGADDYAHRDAADLYQEAAALVERANDNELSEEWHTARRSNDAAFFGKIIKRARKAVSRATSAVSSVARQAAKAAAPLTSGVRSLAKMAAPLLPLAKTVAAFVPGAGPAVGAALSAVEGIAKGKNLQALALDAARGALPGGPLASQAFQSAVALAQGQNLSEAAVAAARSMIPPEAQQAFDLGVGAVLREKASRRAAPPPIRRLGQRLVQSDARGLSLDDAAALCQCSPGDAAAAIGAITGAVQRIARGGSPVLLQEPELAQRVRAGRLSLDHAVNALGSYAAPWQSRERRGVPVRAGNTHRVAAAFEPARLSALTPLEARRLLALPAVARMPFAVKLRMITGADARGITPDGGYYIVESSDYGLQQIATKLGHPGDAWKLLRNANLAPNGAQKKQAASGAFTSMNAGDKLELPADWKTVPAAPPPPAPPPGATPVTVTIPGTGVTIVGPGTGGTAPPAPIPPGMPTPIHLVYKRSADGGQLPTGAKYGSATKVAHALSSGEYPSELAKRYARPSPDTAWRDLRPANPTKKLNADGTFSSWPTGETVNIPDAWIAAAAGALPGTPPGPVPPQDPPYTPPPRIGPTPPLPPVPPLPAPPKPPAPPPAPPPPGPPKQEDVLPTPPKYDGGGGETGGGGSSDYWRGYTADGAVQAKGMLIRYLVLGAKTQTSPPLGTQTVDTTALWDQRAQEATRIFQRAQGLAQTGTPDDVTYQALRAWNAAFSGGEAAPPATTPPPKATGASAGDGVLPLILAGAAALLLK